MNELLQRCLANAECEPLKGRDFGVSLIDPVDQYLKSERAIKYALLFIGLTFAAFFLFEVLKRLAVHPIQYSFVGVAMAMFYLLLISLSEHVGFNMAYAVSATACVVLVGTYVSGILHSVKRGLGFSVGLTALYGLLYSLLNAEDYSLLMGSLLLFMLLGVVMMATRRIDWFGLGKEIGTDVRQP
jgi:inner membrane protein